MITLFLLLLNLGFSQGEPSPLESEGEIVLEEEETLPPSKEILSPFSQLNIKLRGDFSYRAGTVSEQGFSLPSLRLTFLGNLEQFADFKVSFSQTKEVGTASLSHIVPVEAFLGNPDANDNFHLFWRLGLKSPEGHPFYAKDLGDSIFPKYLESYRNVLLGNDLGAEVGIDLPKEGLLLGGGFFNGTGVNGNNNNSSRVFTGFLRVEKEWGEIQWSLGLLPYFLLQSAEGSLNYRKRFLVSGHTQLKKKNSETAAGVEAWGGNFQDANTNLNPVGGSIWACLELLQGFSLFSRYERSLNQPGSYLNLSRWEVGAYIFPISQVQIFGFFEYLDYRDQGVENNFQARLRFFL